VFKPTPRPEAGKAPFGRSEETNCDPKYERAALEYLARYLAEEKPSLADVAQVAAVLAERSLLMRSL
jgi:hypothetical protein